MIFINKFVVGITHQMAPPLYFALSIDSNNKEKSYPDFLCFHSYCYFVNVIALQFEQRKKVE